MKADNRDVSVTIPLRVLRSKKETHDTMTFELEAPRNDGGFTFKPGQFNMLYAYGLGEVPISISGDPADGQKIIHTVRAYGAVTSRMMTLKKGAMMGIRGPFGAHWPIEEHTGNDILLIAGGIGVAPLRPVLYHIMAHRADYGKVTLLYGERTPADLIFRKQIEQWRGRFDLDVEVTVDSAREGWRGNVGVVTTLIDRAQIEPQSTFAMICGPEIMMRFSLQELEKKGLADDRIYISMERNMKCGSGFCGHCQMGPVFICKDGPVFPFSDVKKPFRETGDMKCR